MNYQFGNTFKALRKQRNLTQEQAAEFLGVSSQAISKWETNSTFPDISLLPIIADFFNVSIDYLLCYDFTKRNEEIERICRESEALIQDKKYIEAVTLMRTAYTKFPGNDLIMYHLAWALRWSIKSADIENWEENYNEASKASMIASCDNAPKLINYIYNFDNGANSDARYFWFQVPAAPIGAPGPQSGKGRILGDNSSTSRTCKSCNIFSRCKVFTYIF